MCPHALNLCVDALSSSPIIRGIQVPAGVVLIASLLVSRRLATWSIRSMYGHRNRAARPHRHLQHPGMFFTSCSSEFTLALLLHNTALFIIVRQLPAQCTSVSVFVLLIHMWQRLAS